MATVGCSERALSGGFRLDDWDVEYHINQEPSELAMVGSFGICKEYVLAGPVTPIGPLWLP